MAIRVRDLAKEFKISSSALMKHLKDLGVESKSPMSKIEDDIEIKIRARFNAERQAVRQRELDRRNYQQKVVQTRKREEAKSEPPKPAAAPTPVKTEPVKTEPAKSQPVETDKVKAEPVKAEPVKAQPVKTESVKTESVKTETAKDKPRQWIEHPTKKKKEDQEPDSQEKTSRPHPPRRTGSTAPPRTKQPEQKSTDKPKRDVTQPRFTQEKNYVPERQHSSDRQSPSTRRKPGETSTTPQNRRKPGSTDFQRDSRPPRSGARPHGPADDLIPKIELTLAEKNLLKESKKKKKNDYGQKDKHLKAKINSFKKNSRVKNVAPTEVEEAQITRNIKKTLASQSLKKKKYKKEDKQTDQQDAKITINEFTSVAELAKMMDVKPTEIIAKFFAMGKMVTINQRLDKESLELICSEFEFEVEFAEEYGAEILQKEEEIRESLEQVSRPPVVTIMGHVDHGKTAILDHIRNANVIAGESGGITQHIGAYQVKYNGHRITFLDTPGHEAFTAMRARGADVTDIAIIVVAANESVKTQTIEAIDHAKAAGKIMIIAINKIDLPEANIDRTINDLMKQGLYLENYGGQMLWVKCSAKTGEGIDDLMNMILLAAEMEEFTVPKDIPAKGIVIESRKDARMGTMATILLQEGVLKKGDNIVCGATYGKIRKMEDERNKELKKIGPSDVAVMFGLSEVPKAGDIINLVASDKIARQISSERKLIRQERENYLQKTNLENLFQKIKDAEMVEIKLIIKADTDGSVEALSDSFMKLSNEDIAINIIRKAVGGINEADVNLASTLDAIIIGFHIRSSNSARKLAEDENVEIKIYQIIYEAIEDIQKAMQGMMSPVLSEKLLGNARILEVFKIKKLGSIAGCRVEKGIITIDSLLRLFRNDILVHEGKVSSLRHYADEVKEVKVGSECGIGIANFHDLKENDIIEAYQMIEVEKKLDFS
ncbi:MAG: translation initiation factor IF-2 [Candidatus Cloacimonetes bacterium]|nr:translation initiation factor IF-2 [Candidatus Cloacimonadota bacterium]